MLENYYIDCYRGIASTSKPGITQKTEWTYYLIRGILDTDSQTRDVRTGRHGEVTEAVFISGTQLLKGQRLKYDNKLYEVAADGVDIMKRGHHYETKVTHITGVT